MTHSPQWRKTRSNLIYTTEFRNWQHQLSLELWGNSEAKIKKTNWKLDKEAVKVLQSCSFNPSKLLPWSCSWKDRFILSRSYYWKPKDSWLPSYHTKNKKGEWTFTYWILKTLALYSSLPQPGSLRMLTNKFNSSRNLNNSFH